MKKNKLIKGAKSVGHIKRDVPSQRGETRERENIGDYFFEEPEGEEETQEKEGETSGISYRFEEGEGIDGEEGVWERGENVRKRRRNLQPLNFRGEGKSVVRRLLSQSGTGRHGNWYLHLLRKKNDLFVFYCF